jgi:hypothetical protein
MNDLTELLQLTGKLSAVNGRVAAGPGLGWCSGLVRGGMGYAALVRVTVKPSASICRMWFLIFLSLSVRAW